jgi:hypothetical protein
VTTNGQSHRSLRMSSRSAMEFSACHSESHSD